MRAHYEFLPPEPKIVFPPFILLGLHSLSAIGAEFRSSSVHSRRPPDLAASALLLGRPFRLLCVHAAYSLCTCGVGHAKLTCRQPAFCFPCPFSGSARL